MPAWSSRCHREWKAAASSPRRADWRGRVTLHFDRLAGDAPVNACAPEIYAALLRSRAASREIEYGERTIVGVNRFQSDDQPIELLQIDETSSRRQTAKLAALRARRDNGKVQRTLDGLRRAAEGTENTMPFLLDAVRAYATLGEICDALRGVFGTYQETSHI